MGLLEGLVIAALVALIVPISFTVFWACKKRGEKKIANKEVIRTRPPVLLSGLFLGFALLVFFGGIGGIIYCSITDGAPTVGIIILIAACIAIFTALGLVGYVLVRFNYVVADNEGISVYRAFRKKRYYRYEEIGSFEDTSNKGIIGGLLGFDKENKKIFSVEAIHIGVSAVVQRMREHGVIPKGMNFKI